MHATRVRQERDIASRLLESIEENAAPGSRQCPKRHWCPNLAAERLWASNVRFGFVLPVSLGLAPSESRCPPRKQSPAVAREATASMAWSKTARRLLSRLLHQARVVPCSCKPIRPLITVLCECIAPRLFLSRRTGRLGHRMCPSRLQTDHPCPLPNSACNCAIACKRASEPKTSSWPRMRRGRAAASGQSRPWA